MKRRTKAAPAEKPAEPATPANPPVAEVVALAKAFLADAEAGHVRAAGLVVVQTDGRTASRSAVQPGDVVTTHVLNSGVATMFCAMNRAIVGS